MFPEASLSRTDDRRTLLLALGAAGATLAVVLGVIGLPAVNACSGDPRGVITCLRDMADRKFDLPGPVPGQIAETTPAAEMIPAAETAPIPAIVVAETESPAASGGPLEAPAVEAAGPPAEIADVPSSVAEPPPDPVPAPPAVVSTPAPPEASSGAGVEMADAPEAAASTHDSEPNAVEPAMRSPEVPEPAMPAPEVPEPVDSALTWSAAPEPATEVPATEVPAAAAAVIEAKPSMPATQPSLDAPSATTSEPHPPTEAAAPTEEGEPSATKPAASGNQRPEPAALPVDSLPPLVVANAEPATAQPPAPTIAAPVILAPTIDAIELDGWQSFVSGSGPAGALMRLYADHQLIGESPVEEGRWLVEGSNLLDSPRRELRVEAIEPDTGKLLGVAAITVEIELPDGGAPPDERPEAAPNLGSGVAPASQPELAPPTIAGRLPTPPERADNEPPMGIAAPPAALVEEPALLIEPSPTSKAATASEPELATVEPRLEPLPPLAATVPQGESASVQILAPSALEPTTLPPAGSSADGVSMTVLPHPDKPALIAEFEVPVPEPVRPRGQPVTILRLLPFGDPDEGRYNVGKAIIRRGDTLWSIARRYYGHGIHYRTIFHANRDLIRRPSRIFPGQIFDLPLVTDD